MKGKLQISDQNYQFARHILLTDVDRFDELLSDKNICAYRVAPDGKIISASPALISLLGYKSFEELYAAELEKTEFDTIYAEAIFAQYDGKVLDTETEWRCANGSTIAMRESARATYDVSGHPWHYDGVLMPLVHSASQPDEHLETHAIGASANQMLRRDVMSAPVNPGTISPRATGGDLIRHYISIIRRWAWLIIILMVVSGAIAYFISQRSHPVYESSLTLLINQSSDNNLSPDYNSLLASESMARTFAELLRKRPVLDAVIARLNLDISPETLGENISVTLVRDTQLLDLTVTDTDPIRVAAIANEIVAVFQEQDRSEKDSHFAALEQSNQQQIVQVQAEMQRLYLALNAIKTPVSDNQLEERARLQSLLSQQQENYSALLKNLQEVRLAEARNDNVIKAVDSAQPATDPIRPKPLLNAILGAMLGFLCAMGIIFLAEQIDDTLRSKGQLASIIPVPVLASIGQKRNQQLWNQLITSLENGSPLLDGYRELRLNIELLGAKSARTIALMSDLSQQDKSVIIANLGIMFARAGKQVVLVDANFSQPALHSLFGLFNNHGLTNELSSSPEEEASTIVATGIHNLFLMPSGPLTSTSIDLLSSKLMIEFVKEIGQKADIVLFDCPSALQVPDAVILARSCDATVVIVRAGATRVRAMHKLTTRLNHAGANVVGTIFCRIKSARSQAQNGPYSDKTAKNLPEYPRIYENKQPMSPQNVEHATQNTD